MRTPSSFTPIYEVFLVLEPFRSGFADLHRSLAMLEQTEAPGVLGVDIYYRDHTDVALLVLRYDEDRFSEASLEWLSDMSSQVGIPVLDPNQLDIQDRQQFYSDYLKNYEVCIEDCPTGQQALEQLSTELGIAKPSPQRRKPSTNAAARGTGSQAAIDDSAAYTYTPTWIEGRAPLGRDEAADLAADTKENVAESPPENDRVVPETNPRGAMGKLAPQHHSPSARQTFGLAEQAAMARMAARLNQKTHSKNSPAAQAARGKNRGHQRSETAADLPSSRNAQRRSTADEAALHRTVERPDNRSGSHTALPSTPPSPASSRRASTGSSGSHAIIATTAPSNQSGAHPTLPGDIDHKSPVIDVRFLRGSEWVTARLRSLSAKSAYLVTGALPRTGDSVHIALGFRGAGAMVQGTVTHITGVEDAAETGSSGFSVRFAQGNTPGRQQLIALLRMARSAGVTLKPPPSRMAVRFPVHWPLRLATEHGGISAEATDVSTGGMFVSTQQNLIGEEVAFRLPMDIQATPITGRARIVRHVDEDTAHTRGLRPGYGLLIVELSDPDEHRYEDFLMRIRQRTERRIVVGAEPERMKALVLGLSSAGYAVTGGSEAGTLLQLVHTEQRPPDIAVIDNSLPASGPDKGWLEHALSSFSVPCVTSSQEAPDRTRAVIDRMLRVAA